MKTDQNGCSTCPVNEERYAQFIRKKRGVKLIYVQYDYRHSDGELFSTVAQTLAECRNRKNTWIAQKNQILTSAK